MARGSVVALGRGSGWLKWALPVGQCSNSKKFLQNLQIFIYFFKILNTPFLPQKPSNVVKNERSYTGAQMTAHHNLFVSQLLPLQSFFHVHHEYSGQLF